MTLLEIDLADGKLLIGPPTRFPAMLRVVSDPQRAHSALFTVWQQREHSGTIRRSWSDLFPGAPLPGHSDSQLQQQLQGALRSGRLNAVFVRKPRRALNAVKPDQQRDRVMHVALTNKTVLLAPKGQLPRDLAKESSKTTRADAVLRGIPPKHPLVNTIGQQASRVLPPALANGSRKELVQQLTRQLSSGQLEGAVLDQAELVRRAASLPSAPKPVSRMSAKEKVYEALARSYDLCGGDLGAALKKLRDPHNLAMMVGFMLVLAGVQLIPGVDVVVDFGMLIWLLYTVGTKAVIGVKELVKAVSAAVDAKDDRQLDTAARHFADAFEALGEAGISALLAFLQGMRLAGRFAKAGEAEAEAAAGSKGVSNTKPPPKPNPEGGNAVAASKAAQFATKPNEAVFWSGLGPEGAEKAASYASKAKGTTLEQLMEERGIDMPAWDRKNPASLSAWDDASRMFAQGAKGDVRAVLGDVNPGSVWNRVELPALKSNPAVTKITGIDPVSGIVKVLWP